MPSGRPGGNPNISEYAFKKKFDWEEPCDQKVTLRLPAFMKAAIREGVIPDWSEICRQALAKEMNKTN